MVETNKTKVSFINREKRDFFFCVYGKEIMVGGKNGIYSSKYSSFNVKNEERLFLLFRSNRKRGTFCFFVSNHNNADVGKK